MYNTLFGVNNLAPICLFSIDLDVEDIPRFRDAIFIEKNKHHYIEILARTGGGNRGCYETKKMLDNKNYMRDYDDKYDKTYRHFIYKIPEEVDNGLNWENIFKNQSRKNLNLKRMFEKEFKEMKIPGTEAFERAEAIAKGLELTIINGNNTQVVTVEELMEVGKNGRKE